MAVTVTDADAYFQNEVLHNELWVNATTDVKTRALNNASNMIYRFYKAYDPVNNPVPDKAVFEQSYFLLLIDETIQKSALGVKQVSVSGISISVDAPHYPISPEVRMILGGNVRLGRTIL
jgi:hypothetical protein